MEENLEKRYPAIASWIQHGWIEFGERDGPSPAVMALGNADVVYEDSRQDRSLTEYLDSLEQGLRVYMKEHWGEDFE